LTGALELITLPIQRMMFAASTASPTINPSVQELQQENSQLRQQLAQLEEIKSDDTALHDQFQTTTPAPQKLLPADVVGLQQNALIIDKGQNDNVKVGDVIVLKNNLIGTVGKTTPMLSLVTLLSEWI